MPKVCYAPKQFSKGSNAIIGKANEIIAEYAAMGFDLTLRQLYYQFVARDLLKNTQKEYKRLGSVINDARLAGRIDWDAITDRTRNLRSQSHWDSPTEIIETCAKTFRYDKWDNQPCRIEVWIEKDALIGVLDACCPALDVPYFSCRGYVSHSEMWAAAMRLTKYVRAGKSVLIFHLGDHDPSGVDMTRDIRDRIELFMGNYAQDFEIKRLALNMDQIEEYAPPPNPAKITDARAANYIAEHGEESWELDALDPATLTALITEAVEHERDETAWKESLAEELRARELLGKVATQWDKIAKKLEKEK